MSTPKHTLIRPLEIEFGRVEKGSVARISAKVIVETKDGDPTGEKLVCHTYNRWSAWPTGTYGDMVWVDEIHGNKLPARLPASGERIAFIRGRASDGPPIDRWVFEDEYDHCLVFVTSELYRIVRIETAEIVWSARYSDQEDALIDESDNFLFGRGY